MNSGLDPFRQQRAAFEEWLAALIDGGSVPVLVAASLDQYFLVRDTLGYRALDALVDTFDERVAAVVPAGHWARIESNTLVAAAATDLGHLATTIRDLARQPFILEGRTMRLTASVGGVDTPNHAGSVLRDTVAAMQEAQRRGGNRWLAHSPTGSTEQQRTVTLLTALRDAVRFRQLEVWFQPVVSLADDRPVALEALARWHHPQLGDIGPGEFIPVAEQGGEILGVGSFVQERAADAVKAIRTTTSLALHSVSVSVNVSLAELADASFATAFLERARGNGCHPDWFGIEVTERVLNAPDAQVRDNLMQLAAAGVALAIDDFGAGTSSLQQLVDYGIRRLKIDRRFVQRLESDGTRRMVTAMVAIADDLGLDVVAEGVETPEQAAALRELGCRHAQGFLFAPAIPLTELPGVLADLRRAGH